MAEDPPISFSAALSKRGFDLKKQIGRGAFGRVYRANQRSLSRPVAVKFFDGGANDTEDNRKRFDREAQLLARLSHPSIPYVLTTGSITSEGPTVPYFVMKFVAGETLGQKLLAARLPLREACMIAGTVLDALASAHENEVIHRDISPNNIVVGDRGSYLIDFSLGFCRDYAKGLSRVTLSDNALGNSDYAAPEQLRGAADVDERADLYSVGKVLLEMLGGNPRRGAEDLEEDLRHSPKSIQGVIRQALERDLSARFQSAKEFRSALQPFLRTESSLEGSTIAFCPNRLCVEAELSSSGFYWGPRVLSGEHSRNCNACGTEWVRQCPGCSGPLAKDIGMRLTKSSKPDQSKGSAFCGDCGYKIFELPKCLNCGSLLKAEDLERDTSQNGCFKCVRGPRTSEDLLVADDTPF